VQLLVWCPEEGKKKGQLPPGFHRIPQTRGGGNEKREGGKKKAISPPKKSFPNFLQCSSHGEGGGKKKKGGEEKKGVFFVIGGEKEVGGEGEGKPTSQTHLLNPRLHGAEGRKGEGGGEGGKRGSSIGLIPFCLHFPAQCGAMVKILKKRKEGERKKGLSPFLYLQIHSNFLLSYSKAQKGKRGGGKGGESGPYTSPCKSLVICVTHPALVTGVG